MNAKKRLRCVRALERLKHDEKCWETLHASALLADNKDDLKRSTDALQKVRFTIARTEARLGASHA